MKVEAEWLRPDQAAQFLGITTSTLAKWRTYGTHALPYAKAGKSVLYSRRILEKWLEERMRTSTSATQ